MSLCSGIRADGGRCRAQAMRDSDYCINHHPDRAEVRRRRASKGGKRGGRGRPQAELVGVKGQLQDLADGVLSGEVDRSAAAVCGQLLNVKLRAIETERRIKETEELEERIAALEASLASTEQKGGRRWGA